MHSLTVLCGPTGSLIQLLFKDEKKARDTRDLFRTPPKDGEYIVAEDDFGTSADFSRADVFAVILESLAGAGDAVIERSLQQAKTQVKAQNRAANDPALKVLAPGGFPLNHPGAPSMRRQS